MLRSLKEVQADDSVVGFYQATTLGAFFNQTLVDTQMIHQEKLRHGGVVIIHGLSISLRSCANLMPTRGIVGQIYRKLHGEMRRSAPTG